MTTTRPKAEVRNPKLGGGNQTRDCIEPRISRITRIKSVKSAVDTLLPVVVCLFIFAGFESPAQSPAPVRTQDPLMSLMLSQPKIDVDSPVMPLVSFDPPVVKPGESSTYRVSLNALETAIEWPDQLPAPAGLRFRPAAHGQVLSMSGPLLVPRTTFNYRVRSARTGEFIMPEFTLKVNGKAVAIPPARLDVVESLPPGSATPRELFMDAPTNSLFVGQNIPIRVLLPSSPAGVVQSVGQVQINGKGFIVDQNSAHARVEALQLGNGRRPVNTFVYELNVTPIATGKLTMFAQGYALDNRIIGGVIIPSPGGTPVPAQYTLLDSEPATLEVKPLPRGSELPGFAGAVGNYSIDPPELGTNVVSVGEPVRLKVKIRGDGNLARLVPPRPPLLRDWQVFLSPPETTAPQILQAQGFVTFTYALIPLNDKARATPQLPFSSFDPERGAYVDLSIPSLPITVLPGTVSPADLQSVMQAAKLGENREEEPVLSGLATSPGLMAGLVPVQRRSWFPLLHLVPALTLLGLWMWDRRRRFYEQHPDVLLRRRALRQLRRERRALLRAAKSHDSARFAAGAVRAMTVAVAPHYPAEPRALVGSDVITLLPEGDRAGRSGETVRRLFATMSESRYAAARTETADLLQLRPEIDVVLDQLEARLCN